jgi:hypothetical protein
MNDYWIALMVATGTLATMFGIAWRVRARAVKRWRGVLDVYVERELARERNQRVQRLLQVVSRPRSSDLV